MKSLEFLLAAALLLPAGCSRGPNDGELVQQDQKLLVEFQTTQNEFLKHQISRSEYISRLQQFDSRQQATFDQVRKHKFSDMTAASYFFGDRMKFPSPITQEEKRMKGQLPGSPPVHP